ncbi:MAG TPA: hypothetical protein VFZ61_34995, partial [Polyangiales bacterium]
MKRTALPRALLWLASALAACEGDDAASREPPVIDECEDLPELSLGVSPASVRIEQAVTLIASGGSGRYTYAVGADGSGGELRGTRFVAGKTPGTDT